VFGNKPSPDPLVRSIEITPVSQRTNIYRTGIAHHRAKQLRANVSIGSPHHDESKSGHS